MCLWLEQRAALLREGRLSELDVANLRKEIESLGRKHKKAIQSNRLVVLRATIERPESRPMPRP